MSTMIWCVCNHWINNVILVGSVVGERRRGRRMGKHHWTGYIWEDLSWSHKSLDGVFSSFIHSRGVRVPSLGPQYAGPSFLFKN